MQEAYQSKEGKYFSGGASVPWRHAYAIQGQLMPSLQACSHQMPKNMPSACICLSQGSIFQRISLFSHKNASAIGGTSTQARLPQLYPESFKHGRPNILHTRKIQKTYDTQHQFKEKKETRQDTKEKTNS